MDSESHRMKFSNRGRDAVLAILRCLKLDPYTTTAQDLDVLTLEIDAQFQQCPYFSNRGYGGDRRDVSFL